MTTSVRTLFAFALALALASVGCRNKDKNAMDPSVIAVVNGETVTTADFEEELSRELVPSEEGVPSSLEQIEPMKKVLLDTMIERALLLQAARAANVHVSSEEVDRGMLRISSDFPAEGFEEALAQGQLSSAQLKAKTAMLLTIEKLFHSTVYPRVAVTEEEIRQYFEEHRDEFQEPEMVRAQQIVVKGLDDAKKVQRELRSGKKFADLARKYSLSADAKVGGDLGFFPRGVMPPQFDEVAFSLAPGHVSDVVITDYGFHLFKVLERKAPRKKELAQVRGEIEQKLLAEKRAQAEKDFIRQLREKAEIRINEPRLQHIVARPARGKATGL